MKTKKKSPKSRKPLFEFEFSKWGYDIAIIPRDKESRTMFECMASSPNDDFRIMLKCMADSLKHVEELMREQMTKITDQASVTDQFYKLTAKEKAKRAKRAEKVDAKRTVFMLTPENAATIAKIARHSKKVSDDPDDLINALVRDRLTIPLSEITEDEMDAYLGKSRVSEN